MINKVEITKELGEVRELLIDMKKDNDRQMAVNACCMLIIEIIALPVLIWALIIPIDSVATYLTIACIIMDIICICITSLTIKRGLANDQTN
jgi:carbon starvation protein CstA